MALNPPRLLCVVTQLYRVVIDHVYRFLDFAKLIIRHCPLKSLKTKDFPQSAHRIPLLNVTPYLQCLQRSQGQNQGQEKFVPEHNMAWQSGACDIEYQTSVATQENKGTTAGCLDTPAYSLAYSDQ